ncbi:large ribosomal subunit protein mL53 [Lepeophtheirus salmonis]|uniref:large ribosomal subunit protein mL53 n=1 Tax=Lepeophtheirus salmonis TaxID=72036 RepID=UPI001AE5FC54|nr:39S ribosomal protein L53, mitochondrial-like [Lepeophtheirus salmonis]
MSVLLRVPPRTISSLRHHSGYISAEGRVDQRVNRETLMQEQLKHVNLKPVKKLRFAFDPFDPNVRSIRDTLHLLSDPRIRKTNPICSFKTDILYLEEAPVIEAELAESKEKIIFKTENLSPREIFFYMNKIFLPLVPPETPAEDVKSKTHKKMGKKK